MLRTFCRTLAVLALLLIRPALAADEVRITVLHTNDLHGHLEADDRGWGGMARLATLVRQWRREHPGSVLFLDAGDVAQGTPVSNFFHGKPMFEILRLLEVDAGALGNHEFDWGAETMREMTSQAGYPILCANLVDEEGNRPFSPFLVKEVAGVKVGILGLITPETPSLTKAGNTEGYRFLDPVEAARQVLPEMDAEVILALTHMGLEADRALARALPDIDVIIGGHDHRRLDEGVRVGDTLIAQAYKYGRTLGVVDLTVKPGSGVVASQARLLTLGPDSPVEPDPEVAARIEVYNTQVKPLMARIVGQASEDIPKTLSDGCFDAPLGNLITDALREMTGAQVAVYNWGGIRSDVLPAGEVTLGRVYQILPFDDPVVKVRLKGRHLQEIIRHGLFQAPGKVQLSGAEVAVDEEARKVEVRVGGEPLDPGRVYEVATTEFLVTGGDGYTAFKEGGVTEYYDVARDVFVAYLKSRPAVSAPETGRIRVLAPASAR